MAQSGATILVVDDERTLREIVSRALSKLGYRCLAAENGEQALDVASRTPPDLVVTDLKMPKMDGLAFIGKLRARSPDIPIIIMTGYADLDSARKALTLRVSDYLVKPFESLAEVQAAVARALQTRSARMEAVSMVRELEDKAKEHETRERELTRSLQRIASEAAELAQRLEQSKAVTTRQVEQIEAMITNMENGILVTDVGGTILSLNQELRTQLQAPRLQGTGMAVDRLPGDAALRNGIARSRSIPHLGSPDPVIVETTDARGEILAYEVNSAKLVGADGAAVGIVTTVRKMTQVRARL